jgi:RimJ/RimL family protein N-acetyltransferase
MTAQPVLITATAEGEQITLRPAELRDADAVFRTATDPESVKWTSIPVEYSREMALGFINEYAPGWWSRCQGGAWVIADSGDNYVGQIDLRVSAKDKQVADVGFMILPDARGKGYMTAALRAVVRFGFDELGLERVEWQAHVGNDGSKRVAEKAGFKLEGIQRKGCLQRGIRHDCWIAATVKEDLA